MNATEFPAWLNAYGEAFPTIATWIESLPNPAGTLGRWQEAMSTTEAIDAYEVLRRMVTGQIDAPLKFELRDKTAIIVRREAALIRSDRRHRDRAASVDIAPRKARRGGTFKPLGGILRRLRASAERLRRKECTPDDHAIVVEQAMHDAKDAPAVDRRYRCIKCEDSGLIIVWHSRCVQELRVHGSLTQIQASMAVACASCSEGERFAPSSYEPGQKRMPKYDSRSHCRIASQLPDRADLDRLKEWLEREYLSPAMAGEFADFNAGAEV